MKWLTLEQIKAQCRIEQDFHDEDELLEECGEGAEDSLLALLGRSFEDLIETYGKVPAPIRRASKLLAAGSYKDREAYSAQNLSAIPYGNIDFLIKRTK